MNNTANNPILRNRSKTLRVFIPDLGYCYNDVAVSFGKSVISENFQTENGLELSAQTLYDMANDETPFACNMQEGGAFIVCLYDNGAFWFACNQDDGEPAECIPDNAAQNMTLRRAFELYFCNME